MPFDSEGRFTRLHNWEEDRENGISIMSDRADEEDNNFADGLSETLVKDGRAPMTGNLKMGGFQIKNMANGTAENDATNLSQLNTARSEIMSELEKQSTKINDEFVKLKDAETFTQVGIKKISDNNCPDFSRAVGISSPYTTTKEGWIIYSTSSNNTSHFLDISGIGICRTSGYPGDWTDSAQAQILVSSETTINFVGNCSFLPCKGVE